MKNIRTLILVFCLFVSAFATAQTRDVASNAIPGDNKLRYYRLALPVTLSAYEQDLGSDYNNVLNFWRECEDFANRMFVPLGICFDVVEDNRLVMSQENMIDQNIYDVTSFGTELTDRAVGSDTYDVGMWIHHRSEFDENTGLSVGNGVYNSSTKSSGYAKTDKWVVAHELGHMFGADFHTAQGEGSIMDNEGEFFSYPSILLIREESVNHGVSGVHTYKSVTNSAPVFDANVMKDTYRIPQGACIAIPVSATDEHIVTYSAIGCSSANINDVNGEDGMVPYFKSLQPQASNIIDYRPMYRADINYEGYYLVATGTNIPSMAADTYDIAFLANDVPASTSYDYLSANPFYSNYAVWDAKVQIVSGTAFNASLTPQQNNYSAGATVTVKWGVNTNYFGTQMLRITMSADYGETFPYVLAESVPATDGSCTVTLPSVNVGNVDVDFVTATRSMRGGIIKVEEIGGVAYTLTTLSPENGGGFTVTGGSDVPVTTYTVGVATEPADGGTATVNGSSSATVNAGSTATLAATANSGYKFDGWYLNSIQVSTSLSYNASVQTNATYVAKFSKEATVEPEEPEKPKQDASYYYVVSRATDRHEYLYNNALHTDNSSCITLQSDKAVSTNNGIWYITFNDNTLGIKNGDGKPVVVAGSGEASPTACNELTIGQTIEADDYTYYSFTNGLNCTDSGQDHFKISGVNFVTTWTGHPDAADCQWRLESVDMQGKSVYEVEITSNDVYVTYANGTNTEYAYNGGFFITDGSINAANLAVQGNDKAKVVVEGNVIKVVEEQAVPTYAITVSAGEGGAASSNVATVEHGGEVTLTATANDGYAFDGWYDSEDKLVDNSNPYTFKVTGNVNYVAKFVAASVVEKYAIKVSSNNPGGLAFINTTGVTEGGYAENTTVKLTAVEDVDNSGCVFLGWYVGENCVSTEKNWEITVTEEAAYEARFVKGYVVEVKVPNYMLRVCQVTISDEKGNFGTGRLVVRSGEKVTLSAYLDDAYIAQGYVFSGWEDIGGNVVKEQPYTITVTQDVSYLAVVELASYTLRVSTPDTNKGTVSAISGAQDWGEEIKVSYKTPAYLSAIPNEGYIFEKWTLLNGEVVNLAKVDGTAHEYVLPAIADLNAMEDVEYVAHFMEKPNVTYSVSAVVDPFTAGFISFSKKEVEHGGSITLTASVNEGYAFVNWTLDGEVVGSELELTVNNVTKDLRYVANYRVTDPLAGRWFRLKEKNSGLYMDVDHEGTIDRAYGKVKISAKNKESEKQIILFEKSGAGYKLKSRSGYYIDGDEWNVNTASEITDSHNADVFMFEETGTASEYKIKWYNPIGYNNGALRYFKVGYVDGQSSGTQYVYCDAVESAAATWALEEVADKSKLQELIAEATALFNQVATTDKTKIDIEGKITSNAGHNTTDGNTGINADKNDGAGIDGLTDDDPATYFHSRWEGTAVNEAHYLQINLGESESLSDFSFEYATRKAGSADNTSPAPTEIEVRVSADGVNFGDPVAIYTSDANANPLPKYRDLGKTWMSDVISSQNNIRAIRLTVTNSVGPGNNTFGQYKFFAMGTLNLYAQPSLKEEYKNYPAITEELLLALSASLANANDVNDNDVATTEEVNEALKDLRAQKKALESALLPASFTLKQLTASDLMKKTEPTYIAVKNISSTNNRWFAGTSNVVEFSNSTVLVWEPVVKGQKGSYYIRNTYGKYIQNTTPISFGTVTKAAVFTAVNATSKGSDEYKFNGDNNNENTLANINTADDPNLVRFVTKIKGETTWINVEHANTNQPSFRKGEGGYTVHFVYEATMVNEFTVNVTDAQFATFYAPVKVELPDNAKAYIINKIESHDWVSLAEVEGNVLPEKTAVILHSETPAACKLAVTNETADATVDGNKLLGTVNDAYVVKNSGKSYYILSKQNNIVGMYVPVLGKNENVNVNKFKNRANKAYLVLDEIEVPQMSAGFRFILPGATAVEEITTENAAVETIYDLQGRKLTEIASPGIYIINGKKVFVK